MQKIILAKGMKFCGHTRSNKHFFITRILFQPNGNLAGFEKSSRFVLGLHSYPPNGILPPNSTFDSSQTKNIPSNPKNKKNQCNLVFPNLPPHCYYSRGGKFGRLASNWSSWSSLLVFFVWIRNWKLRSFVFWIVGREFFISCWETTGISLIWGCHWESFSLSGLDWIFPRYFALVHKNTPWENKNGSFLFSQVPFLGLTFQKK